MSKEKFNAEFAHYKKTDSYKQYTIYIAEFKAKHSDCATDGKRPKFEPDSNSGNRSSGSNGFSLEPRPRIPTLQARDICIGSVNSTSYHGSALSSKGGTAATSPTMKGHNVSIYHTRAPAIPMTNSPPLLPDHSQSRVPPVLSVRSSVVSAPYSTLSDLPDLHSRAGRLSLASSNNPNLSTKDPANLAFAKRSSASYPPPLLQQTSSISSIAHRDSIGSSNAPFFNPVEEPWRGHSGNVDVKASSADWPRIYNPLLASTHSTSFGALPPLQSCDRLPEIMRDPAHRTLPFPAVSSPHDSNNSSRGHQPRSMPPPPSKVSSTSTSEPHDELRSPLESSESDAINALTDLAYTGR